MPKIEMINHNKKFIFFAIISTLYAIAASFIFKWNTSPIKGGDQWGYNSYLVSTIIYGDLKTLDKTYEAKNHEFGLASRNTNSLNRIDEAPDAPNGNRILKYNYGVALLQAPFFLIAHAIIQGNGFSPGYAFAISLSALFYVLIGMLLLMQFLKGLVSVGVAQISLILLFFGTNLLYFTLCFPGLSHPYLFFLFSCILYDTQVFKNKPTTKIAIILGLLAGLVAVTRPTELIVLIIPVIYLWRTLFTRQNLPRLILAALCAALVVLPQLIYWKIVGGHWLYDSYPKEGFDFLHPHIFEGLLSFKNGWLSYTPIMILSLIGLFLLVKKKSAWGVGIFIYTIANIFITYSWTQWNYNAGLGSRPMVESYAILALPFAAFLNVVFSKKIVVWIVGIFILFCLYLNILRTVQMQTGNFISEDATRQFNKQMLFKLNTSLNDLYAFDIDAPQPDSNNLQLLGNLGVQDFELFTGGPKDSVLKINGQNSAVFDQNEFNDNIEIMLDSSYHEGDYIKVAAWAYTTAIVNHYRMGKIVFEISRSGKLIQWNSVRIHNKLTSSAYGASLFSGVINEWREMNFYVQLEANYTAGDVLKVYGWNPSRESFRIDNLRAQHYRSK